MSILIAYIIIGLTFHIGFWQEYSDFKFIPLYKILSASIFVIIGWPIVIFDLTRKGIKF